MNFKGHNKIDAGFSLSSMTDLVFLLLVFFVIVSTMVSPYALPVELPKGATKPVKEKQAYVVLRIEENGACTVNGAAVPDTQLESTLKSEMAKRAATEAIVFRPANGLPTGRMVDVLDMAKRNQWKIVLAATSTPPAQAAIGTAEANAGPQPVVP